MNRYELTQKELKKKKQNLQDDMYFITARKWEVLYAFN